MRQRTFINALVVFILPFLLIGCGNNPAIQHQKLTENISQYDKAEFQITVADTFSNPYDAREVELNMILKSPSGKSLMLPAYFEKSDGQSTIWKAIFTPRESGEYSYHFELSKNGEKSDVSDQAQFVAPPSEEDGFLHTDGYWTLKFDSGKPFRGIGENVGWEARTWEDPKWTYDYLLPTLSENNANFFRVWMCPWNFPVAWPEVSSTERYTSSDEYFNPSGIKRLDEVVEMLDSLDLYMMLAFNHHGGIIENGGWEINPYNAANGGPSATPAEFFTSDEARQMFKNQLRYIVARWGYSPNIGAWEFFNEVDNAVFTKKDSVIIPHDAVTNWHKEMAAYLKNIDPYDHIVTTSVSHREIEGLYALEELDLNQMHIYKRTKQIPEEMIMYTEKYQKPFSWGEFGYEWDWNKDFNNFAEEMDHDYKIGLWYGLFNPTPILPMTWWWEFFDERNMTPYFKSVAEINEKMLEAGGGSFQKLSAEAGTAETYAVKCGGTYFVYLLNDSGQTFNGNVKITLQENSPGNFNIKAYDPETGEYSEGGNTKAQDGKIAISETGLKDTESKVFILSATE